ncbi:cytochrome c oxidase assembly factor 1 family protein [Thiorhodovibrio frisius]|uniref:Cytochrome oxidase complex assembly protein 1 n=1 Tax=Thiorhodovibrio frisius TaxID=631362 RepID=H8YX30_9GAMM|nr:cytochrome c oxidase assembly factor 1 family protein [Thiorhodovibrio frisius]EIC23006.1 protein of unknown function (DUF1783) [Thiorhodovibrio frisius]WPL22728.1 Cytochrome oxidase complex assembly protein 1 [Thiorhodovibrio frisius]
MTDLQQKDWWGRNWKWVVPSGCAGCLVVFIAFFLIVFGAVITLLKESPVSQEALGQLQASPVVTAALGAPIEIGGGIPSGNVSTSGGSGEADLAIPVQGPNAKGTLYLKATKNAGRWSFSLLELAIEETGERINLLSP